MQYKQIIFDVDDTLIDFAATENYALVSLFNRHHWELNADLQSKIKEVIKEATELEINEVNIKIKNIINIPQKVEENDEDEE